MLWNFLITTFQNKLFNSRAFSQYPLDLLDVLLIIVDKKQTDNPTLQKITSIAVSHLNSEIPFKEKMSIALQTLSILRVVEWKSEGVKEAIEGVIETAVDGTLEMLRERKVKEEILGPEEAIMVALVLAGGSDNRKINQSYHVIDEGVTKKTKDLIRLYVNSFE